MQKKSRMKATAILLALCLVLSLMPAPVWAVDTGPEQTEQPAYTLQDAIAGIIDYTELYDPLDPATVPEIVGYENAVSKSHVQRLYAEEGDDLNKVVFLNADGSKTLYTYDFPVKYIDENGATQDISLEIADTLSGYETASSGAMTTFSAQATDGIHLSGNDTQITLVPVLPQVAPVGNGMFTAVATDTVLAHTALRVDEKTVEYRYDSDTTIEYSLTYTGFKEDIVVSEYTGQTEYDFRLYTNGLALTEIDGSFFLVDEAGAIKATIGDIIIFTADERNNTFGQLVSTTIVENEEYLLTILIDPEYLADENTAYPIRIDPTVELNYDASGAGAIEDINVFSDATGKGTSGSLYIGLKEGSGVARALMKFPGLDLDSMGDNVTVTSATLTMRDLMCESTAMDIYCYVFAGNTWTESSATWTNTNAGSNSSISTHLCTVTMDYDIGRTFTNKHWYDFDLTNAVQGWLDGNYNPDKGIIMKMSATHESGSTYTYRTIGSYNRSSNKPTVSITYTSGGTQLLPNDTYYLNNRYSGNYLKYASASSIMGVSGLLADLGTSIQWGIHKTPGGYVIRAVQNPTTYLGVSIDTTSSAVSAISVTESEIPERCLWSITIASGGGALIKNVYNARYLYTYGTSLYTSTDTGTSDTSYYSARAWRIMSISQYGNTSSYASREMSVGTSISNIEMARGSSMAATVNKYYSNELWATHSDFTYSCVNSELVTVSDGVIHAGSTPGGTIVIATHKVTGRTKTFYIIVGFASDLLETQLPTNIYDGISQPYDVWPAGQESRYYTYTTTNRAEALVNIYQMALATVAGGWATNNPHAAEMLWHFLDNIGTLYTVDMNEMMNNWTTAASFRTDHLNSLIQIAEASANYTSKSIKTIDALPCSLSESTDWGRAIGSYCVSIDCTYSKITATGYTMTVVYKLHDVYDWDKEITSMGNMPVSPRDMWELHHGGMAKNYEVFGSVSYTITWNSGETIGNGAIVN